MEYDKISIFSGGDVMYFIFGKKSIAVVLSAAVLIAAAVITGAGIRDKGAVMTASNDVNWGLSYQSEGSTPVGNASAEELKKYNAFYSGDSEKKRIYLTFDAGYENGYTANILDVLKKHNVKAAFFLVGNFMKTSPELVKRMADEGHIVGNHTMTHPDMSKISDKKSFSEELSGLEKLYKDITGQDMMKFYRPPQGKFSVDNLKMASEMGYKTVFWSLAYVDWYNDDQPTKEEAFEKLIPRIHNGAVVLLHSTSETNSKILDELLTKWEEMGYEFGTISELI